MATVWDAFTRVFCQAAFLCHDGGPNWLGWIAIVWLSGIALTLLAGFISLFDGR